MQTGAPSLAASKSYENKRRSKPRRDPYLFYKILPLLLSIKLANPDVREKQQIIIHIYIELCPYRESRGARGPLF